MNRLLVFAFLALATLLSGCASAVHGSQFVQQPIQTEAATLYVFRLDTPPYARKPDIRINGTVVAELPTNSYFTVSLRPGKYQIKSDYGLLDNLILSKSTTIDVVAGKAYFVEFTGKLGMYGTAVTYGAGITAGESLSAPDSIKYCSFVKADAEQVQPHLVGLI
ncbi:MAG: hypothetical protein JWP79_182 [Polaromonas sp.]|jgi:hypothetical protein|nr:hypothetical protein [Polaromonas sp.]